jgi:hypothetical protein
LEKVAEHLPASMQPQTLTTKSLGCLVERSLTVKLMFDHDKD